MAQKLHRRLVETCVVVGVTHETDLCIAHSPHGAQHGESMQGPNGRYGPFKQYVVGVLTDALAFFPEACSKIPGEPFYRSDDVICPLADHVGEASSHAKPSTRRSISYMPNVKRLLPFSSEVVYGLPTFCFPYGGYVYKHSQQPVFHSLVLTNMEGLRNYAVCVTFYKAYEPVFLEDEGGRKLRYLALPSDSQSGDRVFVPMCVCLVSSFPYFSTLKHSLSALLPTVADSSSDFWRQIMKFSVSMTTVPVPPAGPLTIEYEIFGTTQLVRPPDECSRRPIDVDLHLPLLAFSPETVVQILTCMLTQQRIIFMSSRYPVLTLMIEALFCYIDPINWRLTYVPVLPNTLCDLIEAPGSFIFGVHSSLKSQVREIRKMPETPSMVVIDVDKGSIDFDSKCSVPAMPDNVAQSLVVRLKKAECHFDMTTVGHPTPLNYEEACQMRRDFTDAFSREIKEALLDMLVSLFGDVFNFVSVTDKIFDKEKYVKSKHLDEQPFFFEVVASDAFERFVEERLENPARRDAFAVLGERVATAKKTAGHGRISQSVRPKRPSTAAIPLFQKVSEVYRLPAFLDESLSSGRYYEVYRDSLSNSLQALAAKLITVKASYLYLRGMAHVACGQPIEALRDFDALYSADPDLFPREFVLDIMEQLDQEMEGRLRQEEFYQRAAVFRAFDRKSELQLRKRQLSRKLPNVPLPKQEFEQRIKALHIALSPESTSCLFNILAEIEVEGELCVSAEQFAALYKVFSNIQKRSESHEVAGVKVNSDVLVVSALVSTTHGMGRLVLTTSSLLFVPDGARSYSVITLLHDVKEAIKYQHPTLFRSDTRALRIINKDRNIAPFFACLKEERDLWVALLKEMSWGYELATSLKDPKLVEFASSSVLLATTLHEMGCPAKVAEGVCVNSRRTSNDSEMLTDDTKEALEMRLDPCIREAARTSVMSIAYVPGQPMSNEPATVWCGMGSGAIMVYKTDSWTCISQLRCARNRITCLCPVGSSYVWAGSLDTVIYVINALTGRAEQNLQNHADFISDIICVDAGDGAVSSVASNGEGVPVEASLRKATVWTGSCNGQVLCWDPETRESTTGFVLNRVKTLSQLVMMEGGKLWCVSNDHIDIVDSTSNQCPVLQRLYLNDESGLPKILEYALRVQENEIWISAKLESALYVFDSTANTERRISLDSRLHLCCMDVAYGQVWVGNRDGKVFTLSMDGRIVKEMHAHTDAVKSMCVTREGHVITGSASKEGKVCVWNASTRSAQEDAFFYGYEVIDGSKRQARRHMNGEISSENGLPEPVMRF